MPRSQPSEQIDDGAFTADTLGRGRITLFQPARGFRSSLDPVLLAGFCGSAPFGRVLDIGCATGALAFLLLAGDGAASGVGVELQPRLAALARRGAVHNGFADRLQILEGDVRALAASLPPASFDLVATNPPFRLLSDGRSSPDEERARAHHEITLTLPQWVAVAARVVHPQGRVAAIFAADRWVELEAALHTRGLHPTRQRLVHPVADRPATRVLVEARPSAAISLRIEPPLVIQGSGGQRFSDEVQRLLGDR
jgi:tRNA1Val (adenine37-N6)-methyltransferase